MTVTDLTIYKEAKEELAELARVGVRFGTIGSEQYEDGPSADMFVYRNTDSKLTLRLAYMTDEVIGLDFTTTLESGFVALNMNEGLDNSYVFQHNKDIFKTDNKSALCVKIVESLGEHTVQLEDQLNLMLDWQVEIDANKIRCQIEHDISFLAFPFEQIFEEQPDEETEVLNDVG